MNWAWDESSGGDNKNPFASPCLCVSVVKTLSLSFLNRIKTGLANPNFLLPNLRLSFARPSTSDAKLELTTPNSSQRDLTALILIISPVSPFSRAKNPFEKLRQIQVNKGKLSQIKVDQGAPVGKFSSTKILNETFDRPSDCCKLFFLTP